MQRFLSIVLILVLLTGCRATGIRGFWDDVTLVEDDIRESEDRFAEFAEKAVAAPEEEAPAELDNLFDRLRGDTIAHWLYSEWCESAFYSALSPCRNAALYSRAVEHIVSDSILPSDEAAPYIQKRDWMQLNRTGARAVVPGVETSGRRTLVLVLDFSCPSCREALTTLGSNPDFAGMRHVAVCSGHSQVIDIPGWEFVFPDNFSSFFDITMTPVYFVVSQDGVVEQTYTPAL